MRVKEIITIRQVQKTVLLGTARILGRVTGCDLVLREFSSILLLCVSSVIIIIITPWPGNKGLASGGE